MRLGPFARLEEIGREKGVDPGAIELWFADEARIGQKNKITRRWAKRGSRPSAPIDQRTASAYIFGAVCPKEGKGAALIMPRCDTEAEPAPRRGRHANRPGAHAAILVDQAGWHLSGKLRIHSNLTLIPLPAKCPELNPQENIWQFMRDNWLSNRLFKSYDDIRPPLRRLEQPHQSALENHVHRHPRLALSVMISESWFFT
jgi:hypothetical protein